MRTHLLGVGCGGRSCGHPILLEVVAQHPGQCPVLGGGLLGLTGQGRGLVLILGHGGQGGLVEAGAEGRGSQRHLL